MKARQDRATLACWCIGGWHVVAYQSRDAVAAQAIQADLCVRAESLDMARKRIASLVRAEQDALRLDPRRRLRPGPGWAWREYDRHPELVEVVPR